MLLYQKVWIIITCLAAILFQSSSFVRDKLDSVAYEQKSFKKYHETIKSNYVPFDEERKFKPKLASNSYSQKILLDEQRDNTKLGKENATIIMLVRNSELEGALSAIRSLEDRFNKKYRYPYTFLNDVPFTNEFKEATSLMISSEAEYGLIPSEEWDRPDFINETKFQECMADFVERDVIYGWSQSYRNMCRFNSGFFFRQELVNKYEWYMRIEPDVEYYCDFEYDPFEVMRLNKKKYGFIVAIHEYEDTIPTLWDQTMDFFEENPQYLHPNNSYDFITDKEAFSADTRMDVSGDYNLCHFWSNFEIGSLDFFRTEGYLAYFEHLNQAGGFYYERWGDAPVHSLAATLLLDKSEIHYFEDIGYYHAPFSNCPSSVGVRRLKRCICDLTDEGVVDVKPQSCVPLWWRVGGKTFLKDKGTI